MPTGKGGCNKRRFTALQDDVNTNKKELTDTQNQLALYDMNNPKSVLPNRCHERFLKAKNSVTAMFITSGFLLPLD